MNSLKAESVSAKATMELMWTRVRQRGDLPGFSKVVSAILGAMRGESEREFNMTKTVLADPALTQKVLRLANSPMYAVFGSQINTISKAVMVLGTEAIGHLALGLKLIDSLAAVSANSNGSRDEMEKAVLAGHVARQVASCAHARDTEEVVVCSMLHSLGRMMVTFYLADRWTEVQAARQAGQTEAAAVQAILGLGLDEVGRQVSQQWGFPASIVNSMTDVEPKSMTEPLDHGEWLRALSTMSVGCASLMHHSSSDDAAKLAKLAGSYADMLGLEANDILKAVKTAQKVAEQEADYIRPAASAVDEASMQAEGKPADALERLLRGIEEMREVAGQVGVEQLMTMALETVHQGLGFSRTVAFLRNRADSSYAARLCLGAGVQEIMPALSFSDAYQPDVFHAALANDKMIFIENAKASAFTNKLPRWWREALPTSRSFVLLPLISNRQPMGFIYGDWDDAVPHSKIEAAEITPLNDLRSLVVRSLK
jgi:HD-like signal output (HDOD) protein